MPGLLFGQDAQAGTLPQGTPAPSAQPPGPTLLDLARQAQPVAAAPQPAAVQPTAPVQAPSPVQDSPVAFAPQNPLSFVQPEGAGALEIGTQALGNILNLIGGVQAIATGRQGGIGAGQGLLRVSKGIQEGRVDAQSQEQKERQAQLLAQQLPTLSPELQPIVKAQLENREVSRAQTIINQDLRFQRSENNARARGEEAFLRQVGTNSKQKAAQLDEASKELGSKARQQTALGLSLIDQLAENLTEGDVGRSGISRALNVISTSTIRNAIKKNLPPGLIPTQQSTKRFMNQFANEVNDFIEAKVKESPTTPLPQLLAEFTRQRFGSELQRRAAKRVANQRGESSLKALELLRKPNRTPEEETQLQQFRQSLGF